MLLLLLCLALRILLLALLQIALLLTLLILYALLTLLVLLQLSLLLIALLPLLLLQLLLTLLQIILLLSLLDSRLLRLSLLLHLLHALLIQRTALLLLYLLLIALLQLLLVTLQLLLLCGLYPLLLLDLLRIIRTRPQWLAVIKAAAHEIRLRDSSGALLHLLYLLAYLLQLRWLQCRRALNSSLRLQRLVPRYRLRTSTVGRVELSAISLCLLPMYHLRLHRRRMLLVPCSDLLRTRSAVDSSLTVVAHTRVVDIRSVDHRHIALIDVVLHISCIDTIA